MSAAANTSAMANHKEFKIGGLSVLFPCKPYPSQFSMMDKIIRGIERQQNCLLESPTGSGKSLALLCSALAWQAQERLKQQEEMAAQAAEDKGGACCCSCHCKQDACSNPAPAHTANSVKDEKLVASSTTSSTVEVENESTASAAETSGRTSAIGAGDDSDDDFKPLTRFKPSGKSNMVTRKKKRKPVTIEYEDSDDDSPSPALESEPAIRSPAKSSSDCVAVIPCSQCSCGKDDKTQVRKVPRIYFGTRTHKQVAQIVRELRKTAYHSVPMTILASREHTCIHPEVSCAPNKNEGCENQVKEVGCRFKDRVIKFQSQHAIKSIGLHSAWDLEDMVSLMKNKKACPYFLTRGLKDQSDLIICPYNYLVDPLIRETMEINLKDQIVLLDEAHNIEDAAREAASQSFTQDQIQRALHNMDELMEKNVNVADISKLRQMCHKLDCFITDQSVSLTHVDFDQSYRMWSGFEIVAQLRNLDLGAEKYQELSTTLQKLKAAEAEERMNNPGGDQESLSSATSSLLESLFLIMKYIYKDNMAHAEDYRASIVKSIKYMPGDYNGSWLNSRKRFGGRGTVPVEVFTLNFWCMNPAVGFADFGLCRSVILTSGTLSPMDSFQSELGLPFPIALEANHVIKDSQVLVGAIGEGPNGKSLQAVYRNMETYDFQDQLGQLILGVCKKVPKGVLCFLPSYKTLEKLSSRWKMTGLWNKLEAEKRVFCEPRGSDKVDFECVMLAFANTVNGRHQDDEDGESRHDGALLFAVCRGKVSEGMDFADNSARAVITVGIPYPNFKDIQVELKRKYNDQYQTSRRLLSGHMWYEIQAFRALNQALGRCIRHRRDWGALIIVDDRFVKNTKKYASGLSKWVRQKLRVYHKCADLFDSLADFTATRLEEQQQDESMDSSILSPTAAPSSQPGQFDSPRVPLHDVSNFRSPAATSTPQTLDSPLISDNNTLRTVATDTTLKADAVPNQNDISKRAQEQGRKRNGPNSAQSHSSSSTALNAEQESCATAKAGPAKVQNNEAGKRGIKKYFNNTAGISLASNLGDRGQSVSAKISAAKSAGHRLPNSLSAAGNQTVIIVPSASAVSAQGANIASNPAVTAPGLSAGNIPCQTAPSPNLDTTGVDPTMSMMYQPVSDPHFLPTMMTLGKAMPTQQLIPVPPQIQKAIGRAILPVPPNIRYIVIATTLEQANKVFLANLQSTFGVQHKAVANVPLSSAGQEVAENVTLQSMIGHNLTEQVQTQQGTVAAATKSIAASPNTSTAASESPAVNPTVAKALRSPQLNSKPMSPAVSNGSPALFDDTPPLQSPVRVFKSLLTGKTVVSPQSTDICLPVSAGISGVPVSIPNGVNVSGLPISTPAGVNTPAGVEKGRPDFQTIPASKPQLPSPATVTVSNTNTAQKDDDIVCIGVSKPGESNEAADSECTSAKSRRRSLFRNTPNKSTAAVNSKSSAEKQQDAMSFALSTLTPDANKTATEHVGSENKECEEERVERRVRGSKRRSLSMGRSNVKKDRKSDATADNDKEEPFVMKCATCSYSLLEDVKTSDYERRNTMPSLLKGMADKTSPEVLYFYGASITQRLKVADATDDNVRCQPWPGGLEALVQLVHCPNCQKGSANSAAVIGARVTLSDPKTATSTGQMWIYSHAVTIAHNGIK